MIRRILVLVGALVVPMGVIAASQQPPRVQQGVIRDTPVANAKAMFAEYCAVCHGKEGKGNGPAAGAFKTVPADLTKISARNGGTFPAIKVNRWIEGLDEITAHGTRDMPVWGSLFKAIGERESARLRVDNLTDYVKSLQQ